MANATSRNHVGLLAIVIVAVMVIGIVMANRWLQEQTRQITSAPVPVAEKVAQVSPQKERPKVVAGKEVIRKTRLSPDRKYEINMFYQDGVEIAQNKFSQGVTYDQEGQIPDGKVKFINESNETYGVEYYRNQKREGPAKVFYSDGVLKQEAQYQSGKILTSTEYYYDGTVRMAEDYTDARQGSETKEAGIGKVYFRDGKLKYEWYFTVKDPVGFRKSYDQNGKLVAEFYYDEYGQPVGKDGAVTASNVPSALGGTPNDQGPTSVGSGAVTESFPKQILVPAN